jgi:hypothetical protein
LAGETEILGENLHQRHAVVIVKDTEFQKRALLPPSGNVTVT